MVAFREAVAEGWRGRAMLMVLTVLLSVVQSQDISSCCYKASGTCRSVCEKMSIVEIATESVSKEERIQNIYKFCTPQLIEFWTCMNQTIQEVVSGTEWWGGACCPLARSQSCRNACDSAPGAGSLVPACRRSDEVALYDCVQRQHEAQWCCSQTQSLSCNAACQKALWSVEQARVDNVARAAAAEACEHSPILLTCMKELSAATVHVDTSKYLPCCHESPTPECRSTCESVLKRTGESQEIAEALAQQCGAPAIHDKLWQCFLRKDAPVDTVDVIPHDAVKLHCCFKATTINCRRMCFDTFDSRWQQTWQKFYAECLPDPQETVMAQCIEEAGAACSLGCSGLSFCSGLGTRPAALYRACNAAADRAAQHFLTDVIHTGVVQLLGRALPLRNTSECAAEEWRAAACAMHIKPCSPQGHSSALCPSDCRRLVSRCIRWDSSPTPTLSAAGLCRVLAPEGVPCVPLEDYSELIPDPPLLAPAETITSPCNNPAACNRSQLCVVNRDCTGGGRCNRHTCVPACTLGEGSSQMIPVGSWARIPMSSPTEKACYKVCRCTVRGLSRCQPLPCVNREPCRQRGQVMPHGSAIAVSCNACACFWGERVCSARACDVRRLSGLPCNCPPHHLPVHTHTASHPNACLAQCAGASDAELEFGPVSPCAVNPCARHAACLPAPQLCLSRLQVACTSHVCVNTTNCNGQPANPVCDTDGKSHATPCHLVMSGRRFAYWGHCLTRCSQTGQVCGLNGITYSSECAAWSELVSVDYLGPCLAVGPISNRMEPRCQFDRILCPPLKRPNCMGFTAPGACCPKCGGALRILYSKKQIDRALYGTNISASVVNLNNILKALERHVKISDCALRGYHTIETEIFISVETLVKDPTKLQLQVCVLEAEKIADLINRESALMSSDLALSALVYAIPIHTIPTSKGAIVIPSFIVLISCLVSLIWR